MTKRVQIVRHTPADASAFTGLEGELSIELDNERLRLHDGFLAVGHVIVNEVDVDAKDDVVVAAIATHAADTSTHGVAVVAGVTETQTLTNKTLTAPVINGAISGDAFLDDDAMTADSATKAASQQSIKAHVATAEAAAIAASQPLDAMLTALAALGTAADKLLYLTGVDTPAELTFPANSQSFVSAANYAAMRTAIGLVIGTDVQAEIVTTRGDIIRGDSSGDPERLALGAVGNAVISDGSDAAYGTYVPFSTIKGLTLSKLAADTLGISAGAARDATDVRTMTLASFTKNVSSAWVVGTGNGSLDTGSYTASTLYAVWLIVRSDTGVVDVLTSISFSTPTMPTNYNFKRLIGFFVTDSAPDILAFTQVGDYFRFTGDVVTDVTDASMIADTFETAALSVPPNCLAHIYAAMTSAGDTAADGDIAVRTAGAADAGGPTESVSHAKFNAINVGGTGGSATVLVDGSSQVDYAVSEDNNISTANIRTLGCLMLTRSNPI